MHSHCSLIANTKRRGWGWGGGVMRETYIKTEEKDRLLISPHSVLGVPDLYQNNINTYLRKY